MHPVYSIVASASEDGSLRIWDYEQGESEHIMKDHAGHVNYLAYSPNGDKIASCSTDLTVKLWNTQHHSCYKTLKGHNHEVSCVEWLPNGDYIVSCSRDETIKLWDVLTGVCLQTMDTGHEDWIRRVSVNHDGSLLASAGKDQHIVIWNLDKIRKTRQGQ